MPRWRIAQFEFRSSREYANPTREVRLDVTFTQGDRRIVRPAFWDGGNVWTVRFAPPEVGPWAYASDCSERDDAGLHGQTGRIRCVPYRGNSPNYAHGFLRVSDDRRRLVYADGTPFFWLGDTHWMGPDHESVAACNHPEHQGGRCPHGGAFQHVVQDRKAKGFTVYQTYPSVQAAHYWTGKDTGLDPAPFRDVFDVMMDYLAEQGFVTALGLGHFAAPNVMSTDDLRLFARHVVARYGAHPVVWITAQEADMNNQVAGAWKAVAEEIRRADGYRHPLSYHQRWGPTTTWWAEPWHDWACTQGGHRNVGLRSKKDYRRFWDYRPVKPWLESEHMYEGMTACSGPHSTADVRRAAWKSILCGSFGYTYGASGIWLFGRDQEAVKKSPWIDHLWYEGMSLPGSTQMGHLKRFFLGIDGWDRLVPRWGDAAWGQWRHAEETVIATVDRRAFVVYFCGPGTATGTLKGLDPASTYTARWFDPRRGVYGPIADGIRSADGAWPVPDRPDTQDWVLIVERPGNPPNRQADEEKPMTVNLVSMLDVKDFGASTLRIGDLNGDGAPDLLLVQSIYETREITCLTAITIQGEIIWQVGRPERNNARTYSDLPVQVYDWDNDGVNEVLYIRQAKYVGAPPGIRERADRYEGDATMVVLDGRTGKQKKRFAASIRRNRARGETHAHRHGQTVPH